MPTSAIGSCNSRRRALTSPQPPAGLHLWPRGFTLIELLVVIAIFGILTTAVALSTTSDPRRAASADAQRLALLLQAAQIEAQAGRRKLAWSANPNADGYSFWEAENARTQEQRWQPLIEDERFHARRLAEGLHIVSVAIDGQPLSPGELLIFRRGDPPLFNIALQGHYSQDTQSDLIELRGQPTGQVEIQENRNTERSPL
ncbi:MAG: type II secretion system protein [Betaproteobacteria bacterium]|nr:type II secretion system protein [Betaproteobacteria bacterium]